MHTLAQDGLQFLLTKNLICILSMCEWKCCHFGHIFYEFMVNQSNLLPWILIIRMVKTTLIVFLFWITAALVLCMYSSYIECSNVDVYKALKLQLWRWMQWIFKFLHNLMCRFVCLLISCNQSIWNGIVENICTNFHDWFPGGIDPLCKRGKIS